MDMDRVARGPNSRRKNRMLPVVRKRYFLFYTLSCEIALENQQNNRHRRLSDNYGINRIRFRAPLGT